APQVLIETVPYDPAVYKKWQKATNNKGSISFPNVPKQGKSVTEKTYTIKGVKYTESELKSKGWTDELLQKIK
ncbi:MAG: hypothetical protein WC998_09875, partial [Candidatus Paceibacterota bacterium]